MKTRTYTCTVDDCNKSFREEDALEEHIQDHTGGDLKDFKLFKCPKCERVLSTKQSLKEHTYTHSGKKPFRCTEIGCGKTFRQSSQLCNHRKVHKEARMMLKRQAEKQKQKPSTKGIKEIQPQNKPEPRVQIHENATITLPPIIRPEPNVVLPRFSSIL